MSSSDFDNAVAGLELVAKLLGCEKQYMVECKLIAMPHINISREDILSRLVGCVNEFKKIENRG